MMVIMIILLSLLSGAVVLSSSSSTSTLMITSAHAQPDLQTIKSKNLVIDLGNGVRTNAQLTLPVVGKGSFPGVLLVHGSTNRHERDVT
jgi:uncharacterized protein